MKREIDIAGNVVRPEGFTQVCVWQGVIVGEDSIEKFEKHIEEKLHARCFYLEEILTKAGRGGEGGRNDIFFAIHQNDIGKFAVPRLAYGIRWIEDAIDNGDLPLWPKRVVAYKSWDSNEKSQQNENACDEAEEESTGTKIPLQLTGNDGNIFNLLALAKRAARKGNMATADWNAIEKAVVAASSYEQALTILTNCFEVQ